MSVGYVGNTILKTIKNDNEEVSTVLIRTKEIYFIIIFFINDDFLE